MWNKILFEEKKIQLVEERRALLKGNQMAKYKLFCKSMANEEDENRLQVLNDIFAWTKVSNSLYNSSMMSHMQSPEKIAVF